MGDGSKSSSWMILAFSGELLVSRRVHVFLYVFNDGYAVVQVFRPDTLKDTYAMATLVTTLFFDGTKGIVETEQFCIVIRTGCGPAAVEWVINRGLT